MVRSGLGSERKLQPQGRGVDLKPYVKPGLGEREGDRARGGVHGHWDGGGWALPSQLPSGMMESSGHHQTETGPSPRPHDHPTRTLFFIAAHWLLCSAGVPLK